MRNFMSGETNADVKSSALLNEQVSNGLRVDYNFSPYVGASILRITVQTRHVRSIVILSYI